jgi:hypothetical protein
MKTKQLYTNSSPGGPGSRNRGFPCAWFAKLCSSTIGLAFLAIATSSGLAHGHGGGNRGEQSHQEPSRWRDDYRHNYYRDPFWGSWYPGYSGVYDSDYWYTPTPEQKAAAQKQVQEYLAAVKQGRKHAAAHRYIAVRTLHPTKKQLQDYVNKRAAAKSAAANGETQLSNRWVEPEKLRCMMVFDTQSKQFVGSGCYVVPSTPPAGTSARFETLSAEFVGG